MSLFPLASRASEIADDESASAEAEVSKADARASFQRGQATSQHMWVWSKGRRAYYLDGMLATSGFKDIVAINLDTGEPAHRATLVHQGYDAKMAGLGNVTPAPGSGLDRTMAIDEEGGRLFLATTEQRNTSVSAFTVQAITESARALARSATGPTCAHIGGGTGTGPNCVTGVSVIDATSLDHVAHIPLRAIQADGGAAGAFPVAMEYSPPFEGMPGKIHMLVQEATYWTTQASTAGFTSYNPRGAHNVMYLVQMDPATAQQDWVVRLDACRGGLVGRGERDYTTFNNLPHQATVFRSRLPADRAVYVGCHNSTQSLTGSIVRVPIDDTSTASVRVVPGVPSQQELQAPEEPTGAGTPSAPPIERVHTVDGPDYVYAFLADPDSGRIALQVMDGRPQAMVWYVFDTATMQFAGTVGIGGPVSFFTTLAGLSRQNGRLYLFAAPDSEQGKSFGGGLFVADIRRTPVPQALHYPHLVDAFPAIDNSSAKQRRWALVPQTMDDGGTRLWVPSLLADPNASAGSNYFAIDDRRAAAASPPPLDFDGRTLDLVEEEGLTSSTMDGAARGFGFRALLVGGADGAARLGPVDPVGSVAQCNDPSWQSDQQASFSANPFQTAAVGAHVVASRLDGRSGNAAEGPCYRLKTTLPMQCTEGTREAVFAFVGPKGPAVVDGSGARGAAEPIVLDGATMTDGGAPASRCSSKDWDGVWTSALFGRAPVGEPSASLEHLRTPVACLSSGEETSAREGDPVTDGFSAHVRCSGEEASGHAYTRSVGVEMVKVAEALSSFRIYRDPSRGIVSRVESVARGVSIDGVATIDTVRGVAESWANGRAFSPWELAEGESYDPNCDFERTAGTCFQRHLFGLSTPGYACGPCGDERAFVEGLNAILNPNALVRLRDPDQRLRIGAENGFLAAIQKPEHERFTDLVLNNDLMETTLATLEIIRFAPPNRMASRGGARGRQIYQFAGVEVSSSYSIQCLLVYDEESNTCGAPVEPPGAITVSLQDGRGEPLAGGGFEVRQDVDADGVLGLVDALVPDGACVTGEDGVGTCSFEGLAPGGYLVSQVAAPPGYAKTDEPFAVELGSAEQRTVAFTNVTNVSTIELSAQDEHGGPLTGAVFAAYPDPDSDGKVAADAEPAASCTTGADGACAMSVPAGSYVLVQTAAPAGLEGMEPVPFTFASGGQVAAVTVTNYPPETGGGVPAPAPAAGPLVEYTPPVRYSPPTQAIDRYAPPGPEPEVAPSDGGVIDQVGGTVVQVVRAPGDALRLLARDPKQAVAWTAALGLLAMAVVAVRRRERALRLLGER